MSMSIFIFMLILFGLAFLLKLVNVSALVAFLLAGIISGPYVLNLYQTSEIWQFLGEVGILFLWFNIGLEINMKRLWDMRRSIFGFGAAQVLMVAVILFPVLFGITELSILGCITVALIFAMSSTSEDLQLLVDRNQLNTNTGRQAFSILLFQDLLSIPLLMLLPVLSGKTFNLGATAIDVLVLSLALIGAVVVIGRFVLTPLFNLVARLKSREIFIIVVLLNIILWAVALTYLKLPAGLGAFLAGMLMSETVYRHQICAEISPYSLLFLSFFFISLGLGLNIPFLASHWYYILVGVIGLMFIKFVAIYIVARVRKISSSESVLIALLLAQGGEFGLLMLQTMKNSNINLIPIGQSEILISIIILSIILTPLVLGIYYWLHNRGVLGTNLNHKLAKNTQECEPRVVICGFGRVGQIIAQMLVAKKIPYIAIDLNVDAVMVGQEYGFNVVYGNTTNEQVLRNLGMESKKVQVAVIALDNATTAKNTIYTIRRISSKIKIYARARNLADSKYLLTKGVSSALPETIESSFFLGQKILAKLGVPEDSIEDLLTDMRKDNYKQVDNVINTESKKSI